MRYRVAGIAAGVPGDHIVGARSRRWAS